MNQQVESVGTGILGAIVDEIGHPETEAALEAMLAGVPFASALVPIAVEGLQLLVKHLGPDGARSALASLKPADANAVDANADAAEDAKFPKAAAGT